MKGKIIIISLVLVCVTSAALYAAYDLNGGSLNYSDRRVVLVVSDSMNGDVRSYDVDSFPSDTLVSVRNLDDRDRHMMKVGQVIEYTQNGVVTFHRITEVHDGYVYARGDNGHYTDAVPVENISGIIVGTSPLMGKALSVVSSNYIVFIAVAAGLCAALFAASFCLNGHRKEAE